MTLLARMMSMIVQWFEPYLVLPFLGIGIRIDLFWSVASVGLSRFADLLSEAL